MTLRVEMHRTRLLTAVMTICACALLACSPSPAGKEIPVHNYVEFEAALDSLGFSMEAWHAGIREVPRAYVIDIPARWGEIGAKEVTVNRKKRIFYRALLPLILHAQEILAEDRYRVTVLFEKIAAGQELTAEEQTWLAELAHRYKVVDQPHTEFTAELVQELLRRVDIVPASLALAQAAYESGYGTSRFAGLGNALYGQWAWGEGLKPDGQREEHGDHRIAAFETPLRSTLSYMHNLNTHQAYAPFRELRARMRVEREDLDGYELAATLEKYSERGQEYVNTLRGIMRVNQLVQADAAYLRDMEPIHLVPAAWRDLGD